MSREKLNEELFDVFLIEALRQVGRTSKIRKAF